MKKLNKWLTDKYLSLHLFLLRQANVMQGNGMIATIVLAVALAFGVGYVHFTKKPDTPIEQGLEGIIKNQTGLEVDFSKDLKEQLAKEEKDNSK